ncbi:hypothetical protein [Cetobacterium ceti]
MKKIFILFILFSSFAFGEWKEVAKTSIGKINLTIYNNSKYEVAGSKYFSKNKALIETLFSQEKSLLENKQEFYGFILGKQEYRNKYLALKYEENTYIELYGNNLKDMENSIKEWGIVKTTSKKDVH